METITEEEKLTYELQEADYVLLWPFLSPEQIHKEFGERAKSSRTIRRMYQRMGLGNLKNRIRELLLNEQLKWEPSLDLTENINLYMSLLKKGAKEAIEELHKRIKEYEDAVNKI